MSVRELARPEVLSARAYATPDARTGILLDNNESPWPAPGVEGDINRYPVQPPVELVDRMARYYQVDRRFVLTTRGSDDAIDALIRCFCRPGVDEILVAPPTFSMYENFARLQGVAVCSLPPGEAPAFPLDAALANVTAKIVFVCSPNNPTGSVVNLEVIDTLCEAWKGTGIVVVDEAYGEFMQQASASTLLDRHENLAVLRTLSKGLALAGARVGALLAAPELLAVVRKVLPPYLLPTPSAELAAAVLADGALEIAARRIRSIREERDAMARALLAHPQVKSVWPSEANFLLVECVDREALLKAFSRAGIRVRAFECEPLEDCLRIAVGSPLENRAVLEALECGDVA